MPTYEMRRAGGCSGAETGAHYTFDKGDEIDAPESEFRHLPDHAARVVGYEDRQMQAGKRYVVREGDAGWHKVYDTREGEYVDGESSRDRSEAEANASRLNDG